MMQEEELVIRDETTHYDQSKNNPGPGQDVLPFTICDGVMDNSSKKYVFTSFEMFVATVIMLSTISGGYLEGYTSPAFPSLLKTPNASLPVTTNMSNSSITDPFGSLLSVNIKEASIGEKDFSHNITGNSTEDILSGKLSRNISDMSVTSTLNIVTQGEKSASAHANSSEILSTVPMPSTTVRSTEHFSDTSPEVLPTPLPLKSTNQNIENNSTEPHSFQITEEEGSWLASLLLLGAAAGAGASPWIVNLGRRHTILMSALPRFLGWLLIIMSTSVYTFYAGRFLTGVSIGAASSATSIYIGEIAHPSLRGSLSCIVLLGVNVGIFTAAFFGTFLEWRGLAVVGIVLVVVYFLPSFFIPNSPSWLILKGREDEARTSLKKLRGQTYCVEGELQQVITIMDKLSKYKSIPWKDLFRERRTLFPLSVVMLVTVINRFSGYNAIITYCSLFIHEAVPAVSQYWATVAVCLVQIGATVVAMFLVESWGRRKLLVFSVTVMGFSLILIAICESFVSIRNGGTWVAVLATMIYVGAYSLGIGPLTFVLLGELFPLDARDKATAIVVVCNWLMAFLVTKTYFSLESSVGISGTCLIYASVCLLGVVSLFFLVPETKGRTLAEIEAHFSYPQKTWLPSVRKFDQALSSILDQESSSIDTYSTFH